MFSLLPTLNKIMSAKNFSAYKRISLRYFYIFLLHSSINSLNYMCVLSDNKKYRLF